jgi:hypothetical protein
MRQGSGSDQAETFLKSKGQLPEGLLAFATAPLHETPCGPDIINGVGDVPQATHPSNDWCAAHDTHRFSLTIVPSRDSAEKFDLFLLTGANDKQGSICLIEYPRRHATVKNTRESSAAMTRHCNKVNIFFLGRLDNIFHSGALGNYGMCADIFLVAFFGDTFEVGFGFFQLYIEIFFTELDKGSFNRRRLEIWYRHQKNNSGLVVNCQAFRMGKNFFGSF